jgi:long-subunit acyl-CoA synthetase (AMP-forming)
MRMFAKRERNSWKNKMINSPSAGIPSRGDDYANICYTSGTTADPKGIILSHRNYTANVEQARSLMEVPEWYTHS